MRVLGLVVVLVSGTASADPEIVAPSDVTPSSEPAMYTHHHSEATSGMFVDFGAGITRIDLGTVYQANTVSFTPQATFHRNFYFGPELYAGTFDMTSGSDQAPLGGTDQPMHVTGSVAGINLVFGARMMAGMFSGALELAAGVRYTSIKDESVVVTQVLNRDIEDTNEMLEARARIDAWVTPHLSIGAVLGKSVDDSSSMTVGLRLGVHFEPYDHTR